MSVSVDPRLEARRQQVRESWARRRLRWIVGLVALVLLAGCGIALAQSPWLSVRTITVSGAAQASVNDVLAAHDVVEGIPTISVRAAELERALLRDPWVAQVDVAVTWPGAVEVTVLERTPAAWAEASERWWLLSADGVVLTPGEPQPGDAVIEADLRDLGVVQPGTTIVDADVVGALEFLALLPADLAIDATARLTLEGIEATVGDHLVLVGNRRDIPAKVATLTAIIAQGVEPGWTINVISPERPGVSNPQPVVEGTGEDVSSFDD